MLNRFAVHMICGAMTLGATADALADIFVYQLPGGARIVTDHPLSSRDYRLVRQSRDSRGAGALVSGRSIQYAVTDPDSYDRLIRRTAAQHQVDPALIKAVMRVESGFNPHAVSDKGAQGLMQVMPETGQRYGAEDLFDPTQNVRAGVLYLKDLQRLFKNNMKLVLAAYNAGENAVIRYRGVPPYDETRDYVRKVMKVHREYTATQRPGTKVAETRPVRGVVPAAPPAPTVVPAPAAVQAIPVAAIQTTAESPAEKNL